MSTDAYIGTIFMFAGNFAPNGFQFCQGQLLSISQNAALFSLLGVTYGGNGQTTFALPDLRGRGAVGTGAGPNLANVDLGQASGATSVNILVSNLPPHNHFLQANNNGAGVGDPTNNVIANSGNSQTGGFPVFLSGAPNVSMSPQSITMTGSGTPINTQDPFLGINFIICVQGIFPARG
jgi:microcystin-dependent protein